MKKRQKTFMIIAILILAVAIGSIAYAIALPEDKCTSRDREINNCVPAGKCHPDPDKDTVMDCGVKYYDKKLNSEL